MNIPEEWKNSAKNKINEILAEVGDYCQIKAPIPIKDVIELYLGDVHLTIRNDYDFPEGVSAFSTKDMNIGWLIVVNGQEIVERRRFSAAHELAHIVLFKNQPNKVFCSKDSIGWVENLCDMFAGDLLMPESMVHDIYESNPSPYLEDIAMMFKVSKPVAEIQLKRLGLKFKRKY